MEEIINMVPQIATFITSCGIILTFINKQLIKPINNKIDSLELSSIKTDLVNFINDVEDDIAKSEIQKAIAHELYDKYRNLGGNSYVREHWEKLKEEGKI